MAGNNTHRREITRLVSELAFQVKAMGLEGDETKIAHIEMIEDAAISMIDHLEEIKAETPEECKAVWDATEYLRLFQANQLKTVRDEFEER